MVTVTKQTRAEIAHRLSTHQGACQFLHGHSYLFEAEAIAPPVENCQQLPDVEGMVIDFKILSAALKSITDKWDHSVILSKNDPMVEHISNQPGIDLILLDKEPTAEHMAETIAYILKRDFNLNIIRVTVWETTTSYATWRRWS